MSGGRFPILFDALKSLDRFLTPQTHKKKRKTSNDLQVFCCACGERAEGVPKTAPNVRCRNPVCIKFGTLQMGGPDPGAVCLEAPPGWDPFPAAEVTLVEDVDVGERLNDEYLKAFRQLDCPHPDDLRKADTVMVQSKIASNEAALKRLSSEIKTLEFDRDSLHEQTERLINELKYRTLDEARKMIDLAKPVRTVLAKLLSLVRSHGALFKKRSISRVKYGGDAVTFDCMGQPGETIQMEIRNDGSMRGKRRWFSLLDDPRGWDL